MHRVHAHACGRTPTVSEPHLDTQQAALKLGTHVLYLPVHLCEHVAFCVRSSSYGTAGVLDLAEHMVIKGRISDLICTSQEHRHSAMAPSRQFAGLLEWLCEHGVGRKEASYFLLKCALASTLPRYLGAAQKQRTYFCTGDGWGRSGPMSEGMPREGHKCRFLRHFAGGVEASPPSLPRRLPIGSTHTLI